MRGYVFLFAMLPSFASAATLTITSAETKSNVVTDSVETDSGFASASDTRNSTSIDLSTGVIKERLINGVGCAEMAA